MAQQGKVLAAKSQLLSSIPRNPHGRRKESTLESCSLMSHVYHDIHVLTHTHVVNE